MRAETNKPLRQEPDMPTTITTATLPNGSTLTHKSLVYGDSIFDQRCIPAKFWRSIADALNLPGAPDAVGFGAATPFTCKGGDAPNSYILTGEVQIRRAVQTGNMLDYTANPVAVCAIEMVSTF